MFESVIEDIKVKNEIHKNINQFMKEDSISATGTSGLSINELSKNYSEKNRKNFVGIHFFNPPYNLNLCEIIPSKFNSSDFIYELKQYLQNILLRKVIVVKDKPGFLANNIGFQFINMAIQYADKYKEYGGIDFIDSILGGISGRVMSPMKTADFVGLDIHKAIINNIFQNQNYDKKYFEENQWLEKIIQSGNIGLKTNKGLYDYKNNKVFDIETGKYRELRHYEFKDLLNAYDKIKIGIYDEAFESIINNDRLENKILIEMLLKYIIYSIKTTKIVGENIRDCDIAMAEGFNWIPPFATIELLGGNDNVLGLIKKYLNKSIIDNNFDLKIDNIKSEYNYKKFVKGKI